MAADGPATTASINEAYIELLAEIESEGRYM